MIGFKRRPGRLVAATLTVAAMALAGCADSGNAPPPPLPGQADTSGYDQIIAGSPVADAASIPAGSWADKIKQRGKLIRGGTDSGPLFSLKDPATGKVTGFDAGLAAMLAHYITGKTGDDTVELVATTVDTRETLIQNGTVDAVFATYTITPARAQKVAFAGPYYNSGAAIMVKADDDRDQERRRPQRQDGGHRGQLDRGARAAEVRAAGHPAAVPGGRAVRGRRAAGPGRRPTCSTRRS